MPEEIVHELTVKPESGDPRHYQIIHDYGADDGDTEWWLVEEEWTGCTWREHGREPLHEAEWTTNASVWSDG